jgi:L-Ala-D/L-Glu epimerase
MSAPDTRRQAGLPPGLGFADAHDLPAMAEVFVAAWRAGYRGVVPDAVIDALTPDGVAAELASGLGNPRLSTVLALDDAGRPVGFARFGQDANHPGDGYLAALYVHPGASGGGVGRRLLRHALDAMPGVDVRLWVFDGNARARGIYERAGFRPEGLRQTDPRWRTPQVSYLRRAVNRARPLPPVPAVGLPEIRAVELAVTRRPLRRPFRTALRDVRELAAIEIRLVGRDGPGAPIGRGTTVATPQITGDTEDSIRAAVLGPIARALCGGARTLPEALDAIARAVPGAPSARAGVDLAVHDLAARCAGTSLGGLLGNEPMPVSSDLTISVDTPQAMARRARQAVAEGFGTLKLKLADAALDVERVAAVHAAVNGAVNGAGAAAATAPGANPGPVVLRLDANQAWTELQAVQVLEAIAALGIGIELVEQPVAAADLPGMAFVRRRSPFPVLADESAFTAEDIRRIADADAADLVNVKLLKCGGLGPAREAIAACAETGLGVLIGCMLEPAEGAAAARALAAAATAGPLAHDLDAAWLTA